MRKWLVLIVLLGLASSQLYSQVARLQAAFIFQFTKMIEWCQDGKQGDFQLVLFGSDLELEKELSALNGRMVGSQRLVFSSTTNTASFAGAELVVVSESEASKLSQVINATGSGCTLVVSAKSGGAANGAGISFTVSGDKLNFEINRTYMQNHSLKVNDQLYKLAKTIY